MKPVRYTIFIAIFIILNATLALAGPYPKELFLCFADWKPYEYMEDGQAKGVNVEIVEAVASTMGITIRWGSYPWPRCVAMAKNGAADGLMSLYRSQEREAYFYYPDEHVNFDESVFITYPGSKVTFDGNLQSLAGMDVLVARANSYGEAFDEATFFTRRIAPHQDNVVLMIARKRYKLGIGSRGRFENMIKEKNLADRVIILEPPYLIKTYFAFSQEKGVLYKPLAEDFSRVLAAFKISDKYMLILKKFGFVLR
jgi:polar amino acid transport system substrate-binding protein